MGHLSLHFFRSRHVGMRFTFAAAMLALCGGAHADPDPRFECPRGCGGLSSFGHCEGNKCVCDNDSYSGVTCNTFTIPSPVVTHPDCTNDFTTRYSNDVTHWFHTMYFGLGSSVVGWCVYASMLPNRESWSTLKFICAFIGGFKISIAYMLFTTIPDGTPCGVDDSGFVVYPVVCVLLGVVWFVRAGQVQKMQNTPPARQSLLPLHQTNSSVAFEPPRVSVQAVQPPKA